MLKRCIIAENRKLHASPIWVIFFVLPLISAGYGTFNYLQNLEILTERWYACGRSTRCFIRCCSFPRWCRRMQPTFGGLSTLATTGT